GSTRSRQADAGSSTKSARRLRIASPSFNACWKRSVGMDMMRLLRRLHYWLNRRRMEDALREEMETHRAMREAALAERGEADPSGASRRALGNLALANDDARDVWIWPWLDGLIRDTKFTARWMQRRPGFAITCIATIAIGTGALTSVLSVVHVVLLGAPP